MIQANYCNAKPLLPSAPVVEHRALVSQRLTVRLNGRTRVWAEGQKKEREQRSHWGNVQRKARERPPRAARKSRLVPVAPFPEVPRAPWVRRYVELSRAAEAGQSKTHNPRVASAKGRGSITLPKTGG